jgi:anti-sigma B factor antagonist
MNIKIEEKGTISVVSMSGDIDGKTAPIAQERILPIVKEGSKIILDMSLIGFVSSAGLRLLLSLQRRIATKGKVVVVGLSDQIKDSMSVTGFLDLFTMAITLEEGEALLNQG